MDTIINNFDFITLAFMQRAFLGGVAISVLLAFFGVFALLRRSSFFGDAIAHSSLTGVALGVVFGINPFFMSLIYAIFIAFIIPTLKKYSKLTTDNLLAIILPISMALGVIILSVSPGYQPELISFLFGSILGISWKEVWITIVISIFILIIFRIYYRKLLAVSFDPEYSKILGINVSLVDTFYHIGLAVSIVLGIQLVGIILVNALLIIPAATARIFAKSFHQMFVIAPIISLLTTTMGLVFSYYLSLPSGPTIAVFGGVMFVFALILKRVNIT